MKKLLLLALLLWGINTNAQRQRDRVSFSFYTTLELSKGIEIRPEFEDWYMSMYAENFILNKIFHLNWGFAVGLMKKTNYLDYYGGIKLGFINYDRTQKPSYGIEGEIDFKINEDLFIGVRGTYDRYMNSDEYYNVQGIDYSRVFVKIGYKIW
ncbi:hypothetical protein [Tenacibaculum phage JQ]|nr:hypothetical protein [Tenacibaculum phage JQ]